MQIIPVLVKEMETEAATTRKMLQRVPADKFNWQPHVKSMTLQRLATHVAELPTWVSMTLNTKQLDFAASEYKPFLVNSTEELMDYFEKSLTEGKARLQAATEAELGELWTLRNGDTIFFTSPKIEMIRIAYCQIVHHRAQLGVFLRLLDIPIPGSYGPSADEDGM
jgi:uncharacterized damage-inducible protein DinB